MTEAPGLHQFWEEFNDLDRDIEYFVTMRLFEGVPAIWPKTIDYVRWRHEVAKRLSVDPVSIQVVGSARLGYSLNPGKNFKRFDKESDLDIAVVSADLFELTWRELRQLINARPELNERKSYLRKLVFDECIALDVVLPQLSYGKDWAYCRDELIELLGGDLIDREVKYRLYRNHSALRDYQIKGVQMARDRAIEEGFDRAS
ncbi:hypothetical protein EB74_11420 [Mycobacterium sp. SWH-M5]|nr:hypothetical protein EB74_11420 [Mycobacterium sp. SWH-M5]